MKLRTKPHTTKDKATDRVRKLGLFRWSLVLNTDNVSLGSIRRRLGFTNRKNNTELKNFTACLKLSTTVCCISQHAWNSALLSFAFHSMHEVKHYCLLPFTACTKLRILSSALPSMTEVKHYYCLLHLPAWLKLSTTVFCISQHAWS